MKWFLAALAVVVICVAPVWIIWEVGYVDE